MWSPSWLLYVGAGTGILLMEFSRVSLLSLHFCFRYSHVTGLADYFALRVVYASVCQGVVLSLGLPVGFTLFWLALPSMDTMNEAQSINSVLQPAPQYVIQWMAECELTVSWHALRDTMKETQITNSVFQLFLPLEI